MAQKDTLEKLLGSVPKARLLRLFLASPDRIFSTEEISRRTHIDRSSLRRHLKSLVDIGLVSTKNHSKKENKKGRA